MYLYSEIYSLDRFKLLFSFIQALLRSQKTELEELANIAQDQVKALEQYNRYQDFEYDSLQRRILELQSLSDEKMVIGESTFFTDL